MNKAKLKSYAPQARKDFIAAVTARANLLGLSEAGGKLEVAVGERKGDLALIAGREWPAKVYAQREDLIKRMQTEGFSQTVDAVAYTWFNRFAALRYMEIHDYLDHGHRVLSNHEGGMPEILNQATNLDLPHFNKAQAIELKLAGNKDNELYKLILVAQCNALSSAMPFLFERIDDETELLLPDNLLLTDSVIANLVSQIPEEDWAEVEIIGWLYQFYISDKKDEVIGKVVKSEDIPAATQLFTPNWIVQYLVQNSVGRLWMMANPSSTLKSQWLYYIEPAEQTPEVQAQLDALIQTRMDEDGGSLNPETITVLDPACGSGHILVVAYDVLKAIYLERGYQLRTIPRLILEKNLFGLDIDDRAAQMAGFALLMKARADDRRLFDSQPKLNVLSLQESKGLSVDELATHLTPFKVQRATITSLVDTFEHAKTFGSLIQIPNALKTHLAVLHEALVLARQSGDMYVIADADDLLPLVQQAQMLAMQFDAVVANPPYMGNKYFSASLKIYAQRFYLDGKADLYGCFLTRATEFSKQGASIGMITIPNWMFLSSFESLRQELLADSSITSLVHNGRGVFGSDFGSVAFILLRLRLPDFRAIYRRLFNKASEVQSNEDIQKKFFHSYEFLRSRSEMELIPGSPISYWASEKICKTFEMSNVANILSVAAGLTTGNTNEFLRYWHEVDSSQIDFLRTSDNLSFDANKKYVPYNKGGDYRKWYGNAEYVLKYSESAFLEMRTQKGFRPDGLNLFFRPSFTWAKISIGAFSARYSPGGFGFDATSTSAFGEIKDLERIICALNSVVGGYLLNVLNSSMVYLPRDVKHFPLNEKVMNHSFSDLFLIAKEDWDSFETSWDFQSSAITSSGASLTTLSESWRNESISVQSKIVKLKALEEDNNRLFIDAYGLRDELTPEVPESQITLARADREKDCQRLISYVIGCMMGRYSLDEPGLIYAHAGNVGFEPDRYIQFRADADGIVPITDTLWFEDDAAKRIREFMLAVWSKDTLDENMVWLAESLGIKGSETTEETIRRYLTSSFYKNHLQTYKKRPIYWLFSSGKQGAFQALVYLHRYNEGTLARMRSEYVVPLTGKMLSRIDMLEKDAASVSSPAARTKISKEIEVLRKQHIELLAYDEKLRHYADMRIQLDLDDGVKVNYGKFGDLLAEVKAVTGGSDE